MSTKILEKSPSKKEVGKRMQLREKLKEQIREIKKTLYGMDEVIKIFCLSKAVDLTIMLIGEHAVAKSALARVWSITTGLDYRIVTSSEVDESMIAYIDPAVFREKNIVQMRRGELMERDHIIIDEFFLWNNKYRAKLHQLLEERTYAGLDVLTKTYTFLTNPLTEWYAGQVEEKNLATLDRIDVVVPVFQADSVASEKMVHKFATCGRKERPLKQIITWKEYEEIRKEIMGIEVPSKIVVWLTLFTNCLSLCKHYKSKFDVSAAKLQKTCAECNEKQHLCSKVALSKPRFLRATVLLAKALAWYAGKRQVGFEEINEAIPFTLPHRLVWIGEEKTIFESLESVKDLVQQFNDDMLAWKNRGIFLTLNAIVEDARSDPPHFNEEEVSSLLSETREIYALYKFCEDTINSVKDLVKKKYLKMIQEKKWNNLKEVNEFLNMSGLPVIDKSEVLSEATKDNPNFTFYVTVEPTAIDVFAEVIHSFHQEQNAEIEDLAFLKMRFEKEISLLTDLVILEEEDGLVRVTAMTTKLKEELKRKLEERGLVTKASSIP